MLKRAKLSTKHRDAGGVFYSQGLATANGLPSSHILVSGTTHTTLPDDRSWQLASGTSWHSSDKYGIDVSCNAFNIIFSSSPPAICLWHTDAFPLLPNNTQCFSLYLSVSCGQVNVERHGQLQIQSIFHQNTNNFDFLLGKNHTLHKLTISDHMVQFLSLSNLSRCKIVQKFVENFKHIFLKTWKSSFMLFLHGPLQLFRITSEKNQF